MDVSINILLENVRNKLTTEGIKRVFEDHFELTSNDLIKRQTAEDFTLEHLVDKILFDILNVNHTAPKSFVTSDGTPRHADRAVEKNGRKIIIEAKPINADLSKKSSDGAVKQVIGLFKLHDVVENYNLGIATDGLRWIFINVEGDPFSELYIDKDFEKIKAYITSERPIPRHKRDEISKKFYKKYNDILHGTDKIPKEKCFINSIQNVSLEEDREEIAQLIINRLIFIKFLSEQGFITSIKRDWDLFDFIKTLPTYEVNEKLRQLFFTILNKPVKERGGMLDFDPHFSEIPYLNGSLFEKSDVEIRNPDYTVDASILRYTVEFLDDFKFSYLEELRQNQELLDPEILGYIFERAMNAKDRKGSGAFYTPKQITQYMSKHTIFPLIVEKTKRYLKTNDNYQEEQLKHIQKIDDILKLPPIILDKILNEVIYKIKICDPAVGSGAFLLAAAQILFELILEIDKKLGFKFVGLEPEIKRKIIYNLYGVDINARAIEIARLRIWLWLVESYMLDYIQPLPNIDYNICVGNSLIGFQDLSEFRESFIQIDLFNGEQEKLGALLKKNKEIKVSYKQSIGVEAKELKKELLAVKELIENKLNLKLYQLLKNKKEKIDKEKFKKIKVFHWGIEFDEIFDPDKPKEEIGFDIVIGNPPYVGQKLNNLLFQEVKKTPLGNRFHQRRMDYFYFFFHKGLDLLKKDGYISFITTNYYLTATYADKLRRDFNSRASIRQLINFNELKIFESALGQHNVITILSKGYNPKTKVKTIFVNQKGFGSAEILHEIFDDESKQSVYAFIDNENIYEGDYNYIRMQLTEISNDSSSTIFDKIRINGEKLGKICKITEGVHTGADKVTNRYIKNYKLQLPKGTSIYILSPEECDSLNLNDEEKSLIKLWFKNSDIKKWITSKVSEKRLIYYTSKGKYGAMPNIKKHLEQFKIILINRNVRSGTGIVSIDDYDKFVRGGKNISYVMIASAFKRGDYYCVSYAREKEVFESPKIVVPQRNKLNIFAYNEDSWYASADVYFINQKDENYDLKYILALLNSKLYYFWLYHKGKRKGDMLELYIRPLSEIYIKKIETEEQKPLIKAVDKILKIKYSDPSADIRVLEDEINRMVYNLYGLTKEEINIVEESIKK